MISAIAESEAQDAVGVPEAAESPRRRATKPARAPRSKKVAKTTKTGKGQPKASRAGTKAEAILTLLRRAKGATLDDLMKATGWQAHTVRGFLSGTVGKKLGLKLTSEKREDGPRVYLVRD